MKLLWIHPLRDCWLRLKALAVVPPQRAAAKSQPRNPKAVRRTIPFLEMP